MSLPDVQTQKDTRGVPIHRVGISSVKLPFKVNRKDVESPREVQGIVNCFVNLQEHERGTHMSRLVIALQELSNHVIDHTAVLECVSYLKEKLNADSAFLSIEFPYFLEKRTPTSGLIGTQGYDCGFIGFIDSSDEQSFIIQTAIDVITVCPCSKEISQRGAHNQRAEIRTRIKVDTNTPVLWLEDLIPLIEAQGSSQVYPILKRSDEKYITEYSYDNAKFVEDVLRDTVCLLSQEGHPKLGSVQTFEVRVSSFESIHPHDAVAYYYHPDWRTDFDFNPKS